MSHFTLRPESTENLAIIYHSKDIDGQMAGLLTSKFLYDGNIKITMIPYNYEKNGINFIDDKDNFIDTMNKIIFTDVTPPNEWLEYYFKYLKENNIKNKKLMIIDHHKNSVESLLKICEMETTTKNYDNHFLNSIFTEYDLEHNNDNYFLNSFLGNFNNNDIAFHFSYPKNNLKMISATYLTYLLCLNIVDNKQKHDELLGVQKIMYYISEYDVWNFDEPNYPKYLVDQILCFQFTISKFIHKYISENKYQECLIELNKLFFDISQEDKDQNLSSIIKQGYNIIKDEIELLEKKHNHYLIEIYDKPYILIIDDVPTYINQQYFKEKYKIIAGLLYAKFDLEKNVVKLSLCQGFDNNIDCNELIKLITDGNGGGHFAASGGAMSLNNWHLFLSNKKIIEYN